MRTPHSTQYRYSAELIAASNKLTPGTVSERAHKDGMTAGEPLTVAMDALLRYAETYRVRFDNPLANDMVLGDEWLSALKGLRGLLVGDGAHAMMRHLMTDSKDNGTLESLFWSALEIAGYTEETANL